MEALIFDLDDTLVTDEAAATTAFLKTCLFAQAHYGINLPGFQVTIRDTCRKYWHLSPAREYCVKVGISSWEGLWASFDGVGKNLGILRQWALTYRRLSWSTTLQHFKIDDEPFALRLAEEYISSRGELNVVYHDVLPVLESLKLHYKLGLLTNGAPDLQRRKIAESGLDKYFDAVVVSGEFGVGKPDPSVFEWMLSLLRVKPEHALMIGDSLKKDIDGACAVGLKTAWLNRMGKELDRTNIPDYVIDNLYDLRTILEKENLLFPRLIRDSRSVPR